MEQTYNGIIEKDIVTERSTINKEKFVKVAGYIMANAGKGFSSKNIESFFTKQNNENLDRKMIYHYLEKMEKACLIKRVKRFNIVGKQSMAYIEKQYAVDTGFRILNTNLVNFEDKPMQFYWKQIMLGSIYEVGAAYT